MAACVTFRSSPWLATFSFNGDVEAAELRCCIKKRGNACFPHAWTIQLKLSLHRVEYRTARTAVLRRYCQKSSQAPPTKGSPPTPRPQDDYEAQDRSSHQMPPLPWNAMQKSLCGKRSHQGHQRHRSEAHSWRKRTSRTSRPRPQRTSAVARSGPVRAPWPSNSRGGRTSSR